MEDGKAPVGGGTPTGARTETLGEPMQFESTDLESEELYRVRFVAEKLDCSLATVYRAVESGALRAIRLGTGKGAVRIPRRAVEEYLASCEAAAARRAPQPDENPGEVYMAGGAA